MTNSDLTARTMFSAREIVETAASTDEREWVPAAKGGVWMRPLLFDTLSGAWTNVVRMRTVGVISRHWHPSPVCGYVIQGCWRYAERDWLASAGTFIFEPAGDVHTLIAEPGESLTLFNIQGALIEVDEAGAIAGQADVFTRIDQASKHYEAVGLGADHVRRYIR